MRSMGLALINHMFHAMVADGLFKQLAWERSIGNTLYHSYVMCQRAIEGLSGRACAHHETPCRWREYRLRPVALEPHDIEGENTGMVWSGWWEVD
jgi:hypothetical protein